MATINDNLDPNKQTNFYDGMQLDVDDLEQNQVYSNEKDEAIIRNIACNGVVSGLEVLADAIMVEPFDFPTVPQSSTNPNLQNFRDFPEDILDTAEVKMYQPFKAETNNLQRLDLKVQLLQGTGNSTLVVELLELEVPSNPQSALGNSLFIKQFLAEEIPSSASDGRLVLDLSSTENNEGISLIAGDHYAIQLRFIRETNSQDQLRVFHSNVDETAAFLASNPNMSAFFFVNSNFQQGLFNENAELIQLILYHKIFTSAVQVQPGEAYFKGEHIKIETTQRFLGLIDRRNTTDINEFTNFVAVKFVIDSTDPESHPRTGNPVDSRFTDSFEVKVFNEVEWTVAVAEGVWLLLATITDRNVVPFSERVEFEINDLTNLAFNDWLNPCITQPSLAALQLRAARPDDFIFYTDNVPGEVPLLDDDGAQIFDTTGEALADRIVRTFLILYLDGGNNQRRFEMALNTTTSTDPIFSSFFVVITDPEEELINVSDFQFDKNELAPNVFYNFVAETERGRSIFIQDFNTQIRTPDPNTGISSLTRERLFEVRLNEGSLTAVINEDLKLGDPIVPFGSVGQKVTGFESIIQVDEVPGRNGTTASSTITPVTDTLLQVAAFQFEPLPMSFEFGGLIEDIAESVTAGANADDIIIKIDGVPVTFSGSEGPDRGGTGAPHTVSGRVLFSDDDGERLTQMQELADSLGLPAPVDENDFANFVGLRVTARDINGRDNSQQSLTSVTQLDISGNLVYRVIAMGRGVGSEAGFSTGEAGFIYLENRQCQDIVEVPLQFTFTPFGASILDVRVIADEQWFGERTIVFATSSAGLADDEVGIQPSIGQVFFNTADEALLFTALSLTATIEYFQLDEVFEVINFYQTRLVPWGEADDCPILNEDVSIQQAVANGDIILKVNGATSFSPPYGSVDLTDPNIYAAMPPGQPLPDQSLLDPDTIALDPVLGKIVFGNNVKPEVSDTVQITYFHLRPVTTCALTALGQSYDSRFDFNLDGRIDEVDLQLFLTAFGSSVGDPAYSTQFDFNNDGVVDSTDYDEFLNRFGAVASGEPSFKEATLSRLGSIVVFRESDPIRQFDVVRAVSEAPTIAFPLGRTVLFFDGETPIRVTDDYIVLFGFAVTLATGINDTVITTTQALTSQLNKDVVEIINEADSTDTRTVIDVLTEIRTLETGADVFDNTITFSPSITENSTFIFRSLWGDEGLAVINKGDSLVKTVFYEQKHRARLGPFKMAYNSDDFSSDGSSLTIRFATNPESTFADGSADPNGLHLAGEPIEGMRFSILLLVPVDNNRTDVWRWHNFQSLPEDQGIKLEFNSFLALDSRFRGKNGVPVLQPFGVETNQVDLRPKFAGGDISNDLGNIIVVRDDVFAKSTQLHNHGSDEQGGILESDNINFTDPEARFQTGSVTDVVYQLQDLLQDQVNDLTAQFADLQLSAENIIVTDTRGCFSAPSGQLTLADAINQIIDFIAWDELNNCP